MSKMATKAETKMMATNEPGILLVNLLNVRLITMVATVMPNAQ